METRRAAAWLQALGLGDIRVRLACLFGALLIGVLLELHYVYMHLAVVRPFLVLIPVDGKPPPVCGFCVLGM